jgi:hypothetical protein
VAPFQSSKAQVLVFLFVRTDCPISNRYAPEMRRLASKYARRGASFWLVYPDATESARDIRKHLAEYELPLSALRDPNHILVKLATVKVTPEAAVFLASGIQVYHGRIDDRFVDFGKERPEATEKDLDQALSAALNHQPVAKPVTRAVGCSIGDS